MWLLPALGASEGLVFFFFFFWFFVFDTLCFVHSGGIQA
jgi:hypothetical protein